VLAFVVGSLNLPEYWALAERGVSTKGVVDATEPDNHRLVRYSFTVGQRSYSDSDQVGDGNPDFENLRVGDRVTVFYDSQSPSVSGLGDPRRRLANEELTVGAVAILFPTFLVVLLYAKGVLPVYRRAG
jgi:hypothetical protein